MSKPVIAFGLKPSKRHEASKPALPSRNSMFGGEGDSDNGDTDEAPRAEDVGGELELGTDKSSSSKRAKPKGSRPPQPATQPPKMKTVSARTGINDDLSSARTSRKNAEAAQEIDSTVYEYDMVYDSLKPKKSATKEDMERKPKYIRSLLRAAEVRKQDALIAEEKKIARERQAEGEAFADKEKFVTEAYKRQQEENRRLEELEKQREEADAQKNEGGGMTAFYRHLLDRNEQRHAEVVKAVEERARDGPSLAGDEAEEEDKEKAEAALVRELNEKGASVAINEDGQVVDKRQLLKGGLNIGNGKKQATQREADRSVQSNQHHWNNTQSGRKQAMRERQSRMLEEQLEQSLKRSREAEDALRRETEQAAKSRKTNAEISSAKERYLARKRATEEAKAMGVKD